MTDFGPIPYAIGSKHWPGLSKLIEELGELLQVAGKLMATGGDPNHWSGDLIAMFEEELGDAEAAIDFFVDRNADKINHEAVTSRRMFKYDLFDGWHENQELP